MKDPKRTDLLNHLATKYNLKRYLEIGVQNPIQNFDKIICEYKVSVDPDPNAHASFCKTSDDFFEMMLEFSGLDNIQIVTEAPMYEVSIVDSGHAPAFSQINSKYTPTTYDLVFIDGLHTAEQVQKDFANALKILSNNGLIVLHDCNPLKEEHTIVPRPSPTGHWNGDVYKFACKLKFNHFNIKTVDIDNGCLVIYPLHGAPPAGGQPITWDIFEQNRKEFLNLISWDEFIATDSHL